MWSKWKAHLKKILSKQQPNWYLTKYPGTVVQSSWYMKLTITLCFRQTPAQHSFYYILAFLLNRPLILSEKATNCFILPVHWNYIEALIGSFYLFSMRKKTFNFMWITTANSVTWMWCTRQFAHILHNNPQFWTFATIGYFTDKTQRFL